MKKKIVLLFIPLIIISSLSITSCRSCKKEKGTEQKKFEIEQVDTIEKQIKSNVYPLPSSAEVIKLLTDFEVSYIFGISNPPENAKKYILSTDKAINLGGFGADLSYATLYNIQQQVNYYLQAIRTLANELNMSQIYDESWYERIRKNFDNKDELVKILTEAFDKTYSYLVDNNQQTLALLVVGGAWIEGMYLTTHVSEAAYQAAGFSRNLLEQKKSFDLYLEITEPYSSDKAISDFIKVLDPIKEVYKGLGTSLTMKNIMDISKAIEAVRKQIIK
jgi:hypothetical protein